MTHLYPTIVMTAMIGSIWLILAGQAELMDMVGYERPSKVHSWLGIVSGLIGLVILFAPRSI